MTLVATIRMYYYFHECNKNGDYYFFPFFFNDIKEKNKYKSADIDFELMVYDNELLWCQKSERIITSLEMEYGCGEKLLNILNNTHCVNAEKILNKTGTVLYSRSRKEKVD